MQTQRDFNENQAMHGIAVALLTEDREQLSALQSRLEATRLGRAVFSHVGFPTGPTDSILRELQDSRAEVVIIDISPRDAQRDRSGRAPDAGPARGSRTGGCKFG